MEKEQFENNEKPKLDEATKEAQQADVSILETTAETKKAVSLINPGLPGLTGPTWEPVL